MYLLNPKTLSAFSWLTHLSSKMLTLLVLFATKRYGKLERSSFLPIPTTVAPDPDGRSRRRTSQRGEWKGGRIGRLSPPLFFTFPCATSSNLVSLTPSQSLCHSARRRRRRCRGRRGKKKRLNQEPECSEWELSRSSKGPAAVATLRNIPTRFQF